MNSYKFDPTHPTALFRFMIGNGLCYSILDDSKMPIFLHKLPYSKNIDLLYFYSMRQSRKIPDTLTLYGAFFRESNLLLLSDKHYIQILSDTKMLPAPLSECFELEIQASVVQQINAKLKTMTIEKALALLGERARYYSPEQFREDAARLYLQDVHPDTCEKHIVHNITLDLSWDEIIAYVSDPVSGIKTITEQLFRDHHTEYASEFVRHFYTLQNLENLYHTLTPDSPLALQRKILRTIPPEAKTISVCIEKDGITMEVRIDSQPLSSYIPSSHYSTFYLDAPSSRSFHARFGNSAKILPQDITALKYRGKVIYSQATIEDKNGEK